MSAQSVAGISYKTWLFLAITLVFWASAFPAIRVCIRYFSPGELALGRFLIACTVVGVALFFSRPRKPEARDAGRFLLLGITGYLIYHVSLNYGETVVSAGAASFLINTAPVWAALLAVLFLGECLSGRGWLGIGVRFAGAALIALSSPEGFQLRIEALAILVSAFSAAIYLVLQKSMINRYRPLDLAAYSMFSGTILLLPWMPGLLRAVPSAPLHANLALLYLGIFPGAVAYMTYAAVLAELPASKTASFLYAVPPLTLVIAWFWLGEVPAAGALAGGVLALVGVALVNMRRSTKLSRA